MEEKSPGVCWYKWKLLGVFKTCILSNDRIQDCLAEWEKAQAWEPVAFTWSVSPSPPAKQTLLTYLALNHLVLTESLADLAEPKRKAPCFHMLLHKGVDCKTFGAGTMLLFCICTVPRTVRLRPIVGLQGNPWTQRMNQSNKRNNSNRALTAQMPS